MKHLWGLLHCCVMLNYLDLEEDELEPVDLELKLGVKLLIISISLISLLQLSSCFSFFLLFLLNKRNILFLYFFFISFLPKLNNMSWLRLILFKKYVEIYHCWKNPFNFYMTSIIIVVSKSKKTINYQVDFMNNFKKLFVCVFWIDSISYLKFI
jgi:hypothetical protein